ncbi:unnamed protein product [Didymodactylos carnosus]|uniref:Phospholipase A2 n=1 Tax=Didymodactylos carnosus TaxID=1234261 RepID=A0A815R0R8_9BILA|nr:unnamed protein product [Didymodactylos carnosus]CAF1470334.1 unnamed protein product [Didymodactylos carnosus]CAF3877385.1 unnamed protein product [Didymodactylos carnosus]CAF4338293.1 unnamed protein product [Didymodactylos carnosus]
MVYSSPRAVGQSRNLLQFNNMISHKGLSSSEYTDYGCWCGRGSHGSEKFIDQTDLCCKIHDKCYDAYFGWFDGCWPYATYYSWVGHDNGEIECSATQQDTCDYKVCMCDKLAADCFKENRPSYSTTNVDIQSEICV